MIFIIAALCAYFIKGLCGFANTLIFGTILSFGVNNIHISPVDLILGFPSNVILTWKNRRDLEWKKWVPLAILVLLGNIPGILMLKNGGARSIKILFGIAVVGIGMEMFCREYGSHNMAPKKKVRSKKSKIVLMIIGLISGLLCGLYGVGALLAAYMSRVTESDREFKANLCAVFITENTFRLIVYSLTGVLTFAAVKQALMLMPAMFFGLWAGMKSAGYFNEVLVKKIVIVVLIFSGISLVITNLI